MNAFLYKILPAPLWSVLRNGKRGWILGYRRLFELVGLNVARRSDFYSPLPVVSELKANIDSWNKPSRMRGVPYDVEEFKGTLSGLLEKYLEEFIALPSYAELSKIGYGPGYTAVDALVLYLILRDKKPSRYLEIGSGLSTYYASLAAEANRAEGHSMDIRCIEPYPYDKLHSIPGIEITVSKAEDLDPSVFEWIEAGDVLFIDSSHALKIGGDVSFIYLEALPIVREGALIHIHDIPFPFNFPYPAEFWIFRQNWPMLWNEAMLLQALLCYSSRFRIELSVPLIRHHDEAFLKERIPDYQTVQEEPNAFSSIWLRASSRVAEQSG